MLSKLKYPLILDGGLSNVLEDFGCDLNNELWVANLLNTNPEAIIKTHLAYQNRRIKMLGGKKIINQIKFLIKNK